LQSLKNSLHFIVDTASGDHPFDPYLSLLKVGGVMAIVCFPSEIKVHPASLNLGNSLFWYSCSEKKRGKQKLGYLDLTWTAFLGARTLSGSIVGGTKDIQEMVNFCAANKIYPEIEIIKIDYINEALTRLVNRDVKYRFVIDIENSFK
jgi:cinnamyl-alcohol dehydrogenase